MGGVHGSECIETKMAPRDSQKGADEEEEEYETEDESETSGCPAVSSHAPAQPLGQPGWVQPAEGPPALRDHLRSGERGWAARAPAASPVVPQQRRGVPMAAKEWLGAVPGGRPDPGRVAHVTVDQHLAVLDRFEEAERLSEELSREVVELRRTKAEYYDELLRGRVERDKLTRDIEAITLERDRHLSRISQSRAEVTHTSAENSRLCREIADAGLLQKSLEAEVKTNFQVAQGACAATEQTERKFQHARRQFQSLRGLACADCRMRASEMDSVEDFFEEATPSRAGRSCYGQAMPPSQGGRDASNGWRRAR